MTELASLVAQARDGDQRAWDQLVDRFSRLVWHVIRGFRLADATAEDVSQTTWLRLAEHLDRIREPDRLGGWLAMTARNECLRVIRTSGREQARADTDLDLTDVDENPFARVENTDRDAVLWRAFTTLAEGCQRLLRLLITDPPLPYARISALLGMPVGSIGPTRARCLEKLRAIRGIAQIGPER
ncbi:MAG: RNA polymerase sigma factor [Acidimicrobiales bacterium]